MEEEATGVVEDVVDTITRRIEAEEGTQLSNESFYTFLTLDIGEGVEVSKLYALSNFAAFASYHVFDCYLRRKPKNLTLNAPKYSICAVACLIVLINTHCNRTKLCDNIHSCLAKH